MRERGYDQSSLSRATGVPQSFISRLVGDKSDSFNLDHLTAISRELRETLDYLIAGRRPSELADRMDHVAEEILEILDQTSDERRSWLLESARLAAGRNPAGRARRRRRRRP